MYSYTYDRDTGGLLFNSTPTGFSKEPRPVYSVELDTLGFDKYWEYEKQTDVPYMWAEANTYWYRGRCVAKLKGGNLYTAPDILLAFECKEFKETNNGKTTHKVVYEHPNKIPAFTLTIKSGKDGEIENIFTLSPPEPAGGALRTIDLTAMVAANRNILNIIEQSTVKKILAIYEKHKDDLDCFHVAFSGGKDSCVLLDLVKKTLPKGSFVVVFGDTGMEFPDTYSAVEETRKMCIAEEIPFYTAKSNFDPKESWELFGPPSRVLRWCCGVHKSTPQTLKLREVTGKNDYIGLAYVGVRAHESASRSEYELENYGKKLKGQYSHNSILEWTSAEVWLYIYANNIVFNEAYKKGSARVGCLCCPIGGGKSSFIEHINYPAEASSYFDIIIKSNSRKTISNENYIVKGGWSARRNGSFLTDNNIQYSEITKSGHLVITAEQVLTDWREWIKTIGDLTVNGNKYAIEFEGQTILFSCESSNKGYVVKIEDSIIKKNPLFNKLFRQVFRKTAYCKICMTCQAMCSNGCIEFSDKKVSINGCIRCCNCVHCKKLYKCKSNKTAICSSFEYDGIRDCHAISAGCLSYDSLKIPQGENEKMKGINCFSNHAPKKEWLDEYFNRLEEFIENNNLQIPQKAKFKRFLRDAELIDKNDTHTAFAELGSRIGWDKDVYLGLMLITLVVNNPQFEWYVINLDVGYTRTRDEVKNMLFVIGQSEGNTSSIIGSFKRITETPLGTVLNFGHVTKDGELVRTKCTVTDPRVVLYGLYKFAEKCGDYKEFTLSTLLNDSIDRNGISPTRIFGLERNDIMPMLIGLSTKYHDFINASFTHNLEIITLSKHKTSADVLELFKGDNVDG